MAFKFEPYIGFSFDNIHSSELGLYRISGGSEFSEDLLPSFEDKTIERTGADGTFYFGTRYAQRTWEIKVGFHNLTEDMLQKIKKLFYTRELKELVFDEHRVEPSETVDTPTIESITLEDLIGKQPSTAYDEPGQWVYSQGAPQNQVMWPTRDEGFIEKTDGIINKKPRVRYFAKLSAPPSMNYVCYSELNGSGVLVDVLKGEMTLNFVSYEPWGYMNEVSGSGDYIYDVANNGDFDAYPLVTIGEVNSWPDDGIIFMFDNKTFTIEKQDVPTGVNADKSLILDFEKQIYKYGGKVINKYCSGDPIVFPPDIVSKKFLSRGLSSFSFTFTPKILL